MEILQKYKKQLIVTGVAALCVVIGVLIYIQFYTFYVVSVNPQKNSVVSYQTPIIEVVFNKSISDKDIVIESPNGLITSSFVQDNSLKINIFSGASANREYIFVIKSLSSTDGMKISDYQIRYSTDASNSLSAAEEKIVLERQQANKPSLLSDPILNHLPYHTSEYNIKPYLDSTDDGIGMVTLEATIYLSREDKDTGSDSAVKRIKDSVQTYLQSLDDVKIADYTILYKIQEPQ